MNKVEKLQVEKFLKKHRVFSEFKRELEKNHNLSFLLYSRSVNKNNALASAFSWEFSTRGFDFWNDLEDELIKLLRLEPIN